MFLKKGLLRLRPVWKTTYQHFEHMVNGMLRTETATTHQLQLEHLLDEQLREGNFHDHNNFDNAAGSTKYTINGDATHNLFHYFEQKKFRVQSVQQHLTNDTNSFTTYEILSETVHFLLFFFFWPFYLICDLVQYVKETCSKIDNFQVEVNKENRALQNIATLVQDMQAVAIETQYLERSLNSTEELLFKAIENDQQLCVKHLLNNGASLHHENILHMTPLMHAVFHNKTNMVRSLINHDPSQIRQRDSLYQRSPLEFCAESKEALNVDMIKALVTHGADINEAPDLLLTAAHSSGEHSEDVIRYILKCNPNQAVLNRTCRYYIRGSEKITSVLFELVTTAKLESVKHILYHPLDIYVTNKKGQNALDIVCDIINNVTFTQQVSIATIGNYVAIRDLLIAAGLQLGGPTGLKFTQTNSNISLQDICRKNLRIHLMRCNKNQHLFITVPNIPLPPGGTARYIKSYILYHQDIS